MRITSTPQLATGEMDLTVRYPEAQLNAAEKQRFQDCKAKLQIWAKCPFETGRALQPVRDNRLYREEFPNFSAFLKQCHCSRSEADRLIGAARAYDLLTPIGVIPEHVSQVRHLISLTNDEIRAAGKLALQMTAGKKLTAKVFRLAAALIRPSLCAKKGQTQTPSIPGDTVEQILTGVNKAEKAINQDHKAAALQALAEVRHCVTGMPQTAISTNINARVSIATNSNPEPELLIGTKIEPSKQFIEAVPAAPSGNNGSNIIPIPLAKSEPEPAKKEVVVVHKPTLPQEELPTRGHSSKRRVSRFPQPIAICLDSEIVAISTCSEIPIAAANWVLAQGKSLPSVTFIKQNASEFPRTARLKRLRNGFHMDIGDGRQRLLRNARFVLNRSGFEHTPISVQLDDGQVVAA